MATISTKRTATRFEEWKNRIDSVTGVVPAKDLYKGGYWSTMNSLTPPPREQSNINLWILSAGYGFIHSSQPVAPYSATFARGNPDSVIHAETNTSDIAVWWSRLIELNTSKKMAPASIAQLAATNPKTPIVAAISPNYLLAVQEDLCAARDALSDPSLLIIISTGTRSHKNLAENLVPVDARFQHVVGGSRTSLNARIAQWIISNTKHEELRVDKVSSRISKVLAAQPPITVFKRDLMSDEEVQQFIREKLKTIDRPSHSRFLTVLRSEGKACEQKRFREIYLKTAK